ncbi:MFS transporter [Microcoleus sp. AR_TQ3_B6]|uniref:MFS transporter n=1 Tax=Microcoleus sp. AR_TQ3_B6 TaxID=3055284 RepID=UPI002FD00DB5
MLASIGRKRMIEEKEMVQHTRPAMSVFLLIWLGQMVSLIGSGLTGFALGIWVYQRTGSVTQFALIALSTTLPAIVISPIAGALVDRWNLRWTMLLSDCGAGLSILFLVLMLLAGRLEVWHICLAMSASSTCNAFQWPAYSSVTTLLVPKEHLGRASGLIQLGQSVGQLISPVLAGVLIVTIQIQGIILLDFATFLFALVTLLSARFPEAKTVAGSEVGKGSLLHEASYGWIYIRARPGLVGLLIFLAINNFLMGVIEVLATPLVLSFASPAILGTVLSIGGSGMLVGSVVMSTWGGPLRLIKSVFGFMLLSGLCVIVAGLRPSAQLFALATFFFCLGLPIINGSIQVIFQRKVALDVQGRVFALMRMIAGSSLPLAYVVAGPLADRVFEPLMTTGGLLAGSMGQLIGVGPGRGIGLMFMTLGVLTMLITVVAYQYPRLRLLEEELPDAIADPAAALAENQGQDAAKAN